MTSDYTLKFPSEAESFSVAIALDAVTDTPGGPVLVRFTDRYAIDVIGEVPGVPGWHVNLRILDGTELPSEVHPYVVTPEHPLRVWA
jgi:hypothetical protein